MKNNAGIALLGHERSSGLEGMEKGVTEVEDLIIQRLSCKG